MRGFEKWRISRLLNSMLAIVLLGGLVAVLFLLRYAMYEQALDEAKHKARIILDRNLATHDYLNKELKPKLYELGDRAGLSSEKDKDALMWMSSFYAIRQIDGYFKEIEKDEVYFYREASVNARNPENEANPEEADFLARLNLDPALKEKSEITEVDGSPYFVLMARGEILEDSCLQCHGNPADAPGDIISRYGSARGFFRQSGETVSVISIRIPLSGAYANVDRVSLFTFVLAVSISLAIYIAQSLLIKGIVFNPLQRLGNRAREIARNPEMIGETIAIPFGGELIELSEAFNQLSVNLKDTIHSLEEKVLERTRHLKEINDQLDEDIAVRKNIEEALKESNERVDAIIQSSPLPILVFDLHGLVVAWNKSAEKVFGWKAEEVIGQQTKIVPSEHLDEFNKLRKRVLAGEELRGQEVVRNSKNGTLLHFRLFTAPLHNVTGKVTGVITIYEEITELKRIQRAMEESRQQTEQAMKMAAVGAMSMGIAHEINQPLNALKVIADSMLFWMEKGQPIPPGKMAANLKEISQQASYISEVIAQTRAIIKMGPGSNRSLVQINEVVGDALRKLRFHLDHRGITVETQLADSLPAILADKRSLEEVVINLLFNAVQAYKQVEKKNKIVLVKSYQDEAIILEVSDNATGVNEEIIEKIFQPFFTTKAGEGMGVGLFIVKSIVANYGGRISVFNNSQGGLTFRVLFPQG